MCIDKVIGTVKKAVDSENTAKMCGMLFPYVALKKRAVDMYAEEIEKSNLSMEAKIYCLSNAEKDVQKNENQYEIAEIAINNAVPETDFSENSKVNEEWLDRFMDSGKICVPGRRSDNLGKDISKRIRKSRRNATKYDSHISRNNTRIGFDI